MLNEREIESGRYLLRTCITIAFPPLLNVVAVLAPGQQSWDLSPNGGVPEKTFRSLAATMKVLLQARKPVVAQLGPIIIRLSIRVSNQPDTFNLLVPVLGGHV